MVFILLTDKLINTDKTLFLIKLVKYYRKKMEKHYAQIDKQIKHYTENRLLKSVIYNLHFLKNAYHKDLQVFGDDIASLGIKL